MAHQDTVELPLSKPNFSTSFVVDLTKVQSNAPLTNGWPLAMIILADVLDFLESGFRVVPRQDSEDHTGNYSLFDTPPEFGIREPHYKQLKKTIRKNLFGGSRKQTPDIFPAEEQVPELCPQVVVVVSSEDEVFDLRQTIMGSSGLLRSLNLSKDLKRDNFMLIVAPCQCEMPIDAYVPQYMREDGKSFCSRRDKNECTSGKNLENLGSIEILRSVRNFLSDNVVYIDGQYVGHKGLPQLLDQSLYSNATILASFIEKRDNDTLVSESPGGGSTTPRRSAVSASGATGILDRCDSSDCTNVSKGTTAFLWFDAANEESWTHQDHSNIRCILPVSQDGDPIEEWRGAEVWRDEYNSSHYLPGCPWDTAPTPLTTPPRLDCITREFYWSGSALLSKACVDFWIREIPDKDALNCEEKRSELEGRNHIRHLRKMFERSYNLEGDREKVKELLMNVQGLSDEGVLRIVKGKMTAHDDMRNYLTEKPNFYNLRESQELLEHLGSSRSVFDLICYASSAQYDQRAKAWGSIFQVINSRCQKGSHADISFALLHSQTFQMKQDVPKNLAPEVYGTEVAASIQPGKILHWKIKDKQSTPKALEEIKRDIIWNYNSKTHEDDNLPLLPCILGCAMIGRY